MEVYENNKKSHISTYGLAAFLLLTPFEYPLADLSSISPLRLVGLVAMLMALLDIIRFHDFRIDYKFIGVFLWLLYGLITYAWAPNEYRFKLFYSLYLNNGLMFLIFSIIKFNKREVEILKNSVIFGVGLLLIYMTFVPGSTIYSTYQHRLTLNAGTGGLDQNYLASLMLIAFGIVINKLLNARNGMMIKFIMILYCLSVCWYIILTGSRSGILAIILILLLNVNISWKSRLFFAISLVVFILIILPILSSTLSADLLDRFTFSALTGKEAESGTRLIIWKVALKSLKGVWIWIGHGVGSSQSIVGNAIGTGVDMAIHNHYIAMLTEVGIIGFLSLNYTIIKMMKNTLSNDKSVSYAMFGILFMAFFLDVVTTKFFWSSLLLLSATCKTNNYYKQEEKNENWNINIS